MGRKHHGRGLGVPLVAVWVLAVGVGLSGLLKYAGTPGVSATPPLLWPAEASIQRARDRLTLLIFLHPRCPCSDSTIEELAHIVAAAPERLKVYVVFYAPEHADRQWVQGRLWQSAAIVPGVKSIEDWNGQEVKRFRTATSGQTLVYDSAGKLRFSGGITASRGHVGDNDGRDAIVSLALHGSSALATAPVFGCSLLGTSPKENGQ